MLTIYGLRTEYLENPVGIDARNPRFSWKLESDGYCVSQTAYQIMAESEGEVLWDSGKVREGGSQRIRYGGKALQSCQTVTWRVKVTVQAKSRLEDTDFVEETAISDTASFTMGLLEPSDWKCRWIEPEGKIDIQSPQPSPIMCRSFTIKPGLKRAYIFQTAHGLYEYWINGQCGTEDRFKPGFTSYYYRMQYQMHDITSLLHTGQNSWAVQMGDGWWRGHCGGIRNSFGFKLQFLGQIMLAFEDGSVEYVCSDERFRCSTGGLLVSDMFMGDIYDARLEPKGWKESGFDFTGWRNVHFAQDPGEAELIPSRSVPVREKEQFKPALIHDAAGRLVLDFGQNIAGYVHMVLRGTKSGQEVHLTHGEDIDASGCFSQENIRQLGCKDMIHFQETIYICRGGETEEYCPMFSVHGFRYVLLEGYREDKIKEGDFTAIALYSAMEETGDFTCSNLLINRLVKNSRWSQKGNFLDVAVDCPTRERNAWTGDNQIYVKTASRFMNVYPFYEKWLQDQAIEQYESGKVSISFPCTTSPHHLDTLERLKATNPLAALAGPSGNGNIGEDCAGWGDAAAYLPYIIYLVYGDVQILRNQYATAKKWVDYMLFCAKEHNELYADQPQYHTMGKDGILDAEFIYDTRMHYGEWQEPMQHQGDVEASPEIFARMVKMGKPKVATAYMCRSAENVADMAEVLAANMESSISNMTAASTVGEDALAGGILSGNAYEYKKDAIKYRRIADRIRGVYEKYLIEEDGAIEPGHQAAYVRALCMNLCHGEKREKVEKHLEQEVIKNGYKLNTGFLSTPFLLPVLVDMGRTDLAFRLLEQTQSPSWLHSVTLGATTIPEGWYSLDEHKDSYNHYSFGAVCDFLFGYVAGIRPVWEKPGYEEFVLKPVYGGSLTEARGEYESLYGRIISEWKLERGVFLYACRIPVNTKARLILPDGSEKLLGSGEYEFRIAV